MSVENELRAQIIAGVAPVASRVYPTKLPQNATFPAIRYNRISALRDYTLTGPDCLPAARFQVDVFADTFTESRSVWELLRKALDGFEGSDIRYITLDNETEDYEDDTQLFRVIGDFVVQYVETF